MFACVHIYVHMHISMCIWSPKVDVKNIPTWLSTSSLFTRPAILADQ